MASAPEDHPASARDAAVAADIAALASPRGGDSPLPPECTTHSKESITPRSSPPPAASTTANKGRGSQGLGLGSSTEGESQIFQVPTFRLAGLGLADSPESLGRGGSNPEWATVVGSGDAGGGGGGVVRRGGGAGGGGGGEEVEEEEDVA